MHWRMLVFSDLQRLSVPAQFFAFSDAYLDSAVSLCDALCATSATVTYAHGAAVMSLTFHSIELFLKAAILQRSPGEQFSGSRGHNLDYLYQRYANLYPAKPIRLTYLSSGKSLILKVWTLGLLRNYWRSSSNKKRQCHTIR